MITNIYSTSLGETKSFPKITIKKNAVSVPFQSLKNSKPAAVYSLNNLKAKYMPVSFCGGDSASSNYWTQRNKSLVTTGRTPVDEILNRIKISKNLLKGNYYDEFTNDLAVLLGSDKDVFIKTAPDTFPQIMAHSMTKKIQEGNYKSIGKPEVVYIEDLLNFSSEIKDSDIFGNILQNLSQSTAGGKSKLVFINNFEKVIDKFLANYKDKGFRNSQPETLKEYLNHYKRLHIVGLMNKLPKETAGKDEEAIAQMEEIFRGFPEIELGGLNIKEAKEFFKQNPQHVSSALNKYGEHFNVKISENALNHLIEKASVVMESPLPDSALKLLRMVGVSKVNDVKLSDGSNEVLIKTTDVKNFFKLHPELIDIYKPEAGQFRMAEDINTKLSDVGGISAIREDFDDLVAYLKNPKKFIAENGYAPKGILMVGDPGNGKTLLARAVAGETNTPFFPVSGSEFVEKYVGVGASRVRKLWGEALKAAKASPNNTSIIFIDEFDALGRRRGLDNNSERENTLNELLVKMDGFNAKESKSKVIVLAATNRDDILDEAATRPGRFDMSINVKKPRTIADRLEILNIHARKLKFANEAEKAKILKEAAQITDNMSGVEIAEVLKRAQKVVSKRADNKFITGNDITEGFLQVISGPVNKLGDERPIEDILKTFRHEGGHAVMIDFFEELFDEKISFITLEPRGNFLGAVHINTSKVNPDFKSVLLSGAVRYGGGLAEPDFDTIGNAAGVRGDVEQATKLFKDAIDNWGAGKFTPSMTMTDDLKEVFKEERKKDLILFSETSRNKLAKKVIDFHSEFLDEYVEMFKKSLGKGGENLTGKAFKALRKGWIERTGKTELASNLLKECKEIIQEAFNAVKKVA